MNFLIYSFNYIPIITPPKRAIPTEKIFLRDIVMVCCENKNINCCATKMEIYMLNKFIEINMKFITL